MFHKVTFKSALDLLEDALDGSGTIATNEAVRNIKKTKNSITILIKRVDNYQPLLESGGIKLCTVLQLKSKGIGIIIRNIQF